ncbi:restriction endonuclease subunit S [Acinetobacter baumannii]|uniref:restriction endonuclease subunit S n=1 Tax=Acinetobacter baumannii TaxID=470 RepID=UPI003A879854|nr:restriction endonuclease subunit S [Acinetobacter baumannii]
MEKQKCPEVRFKGFTLEWEEFKLENMFTFYRGESFSKSDIVKDGNFKCIHYGELFTKYNSVIDEVLSSTNIKGLNFGRIGDILMPSSDVTPDGLAKASCLKVDNVLLGGDINILRPVSLISSVFISYQINHSKEKILKCVTGTTVKHVYNKDLKELGYLITAFKEQTQIGNFFQNLDQSIALHEKKLAQTQNLKKAMLEKMFPKAGSKQPEIRLKGFSGDWQVDAIGNVLQEVFRPINLDNETKYRLVTVKRRNGGIAERAILKGKDILVKSQFEIKAGDYVISKRQVVHGATGLVPHELDGSIVSNEYLVGQGTDKLNIEFFALLSTLPEMYKKFFLSSYGVDIEKLFFDVIDWKKREILLPSLAEQIQIAVVFKQLDETLVLQQQQLQTLKNLKQAFLEKMFV